MAVVAWRATGGGVAGVSPLKMASEGAAAALAAASRAGGARCACAHERACRE